MRNLLSHTITEGDYLETNESLFFAVKGCIHPPDRVLACLRYVPDLQGDRQKAGIRYKRLYYFAEQRRILETSYPQYLAFEPTLLSITQSVPRQSIHRVFDPRARLKEMFVKAELDEVEQDAKAFSEELIKETGVSLNNFGLSGSVLVGLHTLQSDLDMIVYGEQNCRAVQKTLNTHRGERESLHRESEQVCHGQFRNRPFFIRFLMDPTEAGEKYGDRCYFPLGQAQIVATIKDDRLAIFTPCHYPVEHVQFLHGRPVNDLLEVVSFRGRFCEQAHTSDRIRAMGTLERVQEKSGSSWHQLIVGNDEEDTIVVWR